MPTLRPAPVLLALVGLLGSLCAACSSPSGGAGGAVAAPFPDDLTAYVDQRRIQRAGRTVFVRLVEAGDHEIEVERAEVGSDRFADVTWTGPTTFTREADLEFELPTGRCGTGSDARVELTYRVDGGPAQVSSTVATDRYGAVGSFLDRDCAQATVVAAAEMVVGEARVTGEGRDAVLTLPLTFLDRAGPADVRILGFGDTTLFRVADREARLGGDPSVTLGTGAQPSLLPLELVPGRCDAHALAEDKVGTLVPVFVAAPDLPPDSAFYLQVDEATRTLMRGFFADTCGF